MQLHRCEPVKPFAGAVEIDCQRAFQAARGDEIGDVAGIADADFLQHFVVRAEGPIDPGEHGAELIRLAVAFVGVLLCLGRRWAESARTGRGLHRFEFIGGDLQVDGPHFGRTECVFGSADRLRAVGGKGFVSEIC